MSRGAASSGSLFSRDAGAGTRRPRCPLPPDPKTARRGLRHPRPAGLPEGARQKLAGSHLPNPASLEYNGLQQPAKMPGRPVVQVP